MKFSLGKSHLDYKVLHKLAQTPKPELVLEDAERKRLRQFRKRVDETIQSGKTIYGINTGFGLLADVRIEKDKLEQLQLNLVRSHACAVGSPISLEHSRALLILRIHTFCLGYSAVSEELVDQLLEFIRHDLIPVVPEQGSVGASGDLAPLAHLALPLLGEGKVYWEGKIIPAKEGLKAAGLKPLALKPKEGLSLINGTHFTTTLAAFALEQAETFLFAADCIAALSLDAVKGTTVALDSRIHQARPHKAQKDVAERILKLFEGRDEIRDSHKDCGKVQDPYSFRCIPQVHGSARSTFDFVKEVVNTELNSVTDNPLVFAEGDILSGGNFHAQPIAQAMDFLAIAMTDMGTMMERRIEKLTNPTMSGLPAFLVRDSGLNSGFMIPHVVAAALASENKTLAHPASVDTIPTSADKEDHVSMGPWAAVKALRILNNCSKIAAIEALAAAQGVSLLSPLKPAPKLKKLYDAIRKISAEYTQDRSLSDDIEKIATWIRENGVTACML